MYIKLGNKFIDISTMKRNRGRYTVEHNGKTYYLALWLVKKIKKDIKKWSDMNDRI